MLARFWGTRGSIPAPGPRTAKYGGNTSCVELRVGDGTLIILDCGTGIRELGLELLRSQKKIDRIYLLIGHTHWDHIQGFPFFTPAFLPKIELNVFAPTGFQRTLEDSLSGQMQYSYFPVKLQDLSSQIRFTELEEGFLRLGDVLVETQYLNHTAPTIAYKISHDGATVAYVTDHEPFWTSPDGSLNHPGDQRHIEFLRGSDLIIHDAQYNDEEYPSKKGWGHSTISYATGVAMAAGARRLALFHHDPTHDDRWVEEFEAKARNQVAAAGSSLDVFASAEGMVVEFEGSSSTTVPVPGSALAPRPVQGGRVLVVTGTASEARAIEQVLSEDGLVVDSCPTGARAHEVAVEVLPDIAIVNATLSDGPGASFIHTIRTAAGKPTMPVLILTPDNAGEAPVYSAETTVTDYLTTPFSAPMLRTRVRVWLSRTMSAGLEVIGTPLQPDIIPLRASSPEGLTYSEIRASIELLSFLTAQQLDRLLSKATQRVFPVGQPVILQGDPGHFAYVVLSGRVRVVEAVPDSPVEMFLGELGQGQVFGELGILQNRPRSATIVPLERTVCLMIPEEAFLVAISESPGMALALVKVLAGRLYDADRMLARFGPDTLTGLPARRAFHDLYKRLVTGIRRRGSSLVVISIDVVHLKDINDAHGYEAGDGVLKTLADVLLESSRVTDLVSRCGGDEFAAILVDAPESHVKQVVSRIMERFGVECARRSLATPELRVGTVVSTNPPETVDDLLRVADENSRVLSLRARSAYDT